MTQDFATYRSINPDGRFSDWLRLRAEPHWTAATTHPFTVAIGDNNSDFDAYGRYVTEDRHFVGAFTSVIGYTLAKAPELKTQRRLARFIAGEINEDFDYFDRSFPALGIDPQAALASEPLPATKEISETMLRAARDGGYADGLASILAAEWVYLTWGLREAQKPRPTRAYLAEWIDLHAVPAFEEFVTWLRGEMDKAGADLPPEHQEVLARHFAECCRLEAAFFSQVQ